MDTDTGPNGTDPPTPYARKLRLNSLPACIRSLARVVRDIDAVKFLAPNEVHKYRLLVYGISILIQGHRALAEIDIAAEIQELREKVDSYQTRHLEEWRP